jgi:glycerol-3-phosphate acyltransferase PlsY
MWYPIILIALTAYLLGNLNGAVCMSTLLEKDDVRNHGSGNAGMTNFLRSYGGWKTLLVILIDMGKTVIACLVGRYMLDALGYGQEGAILAAVAVSLGHDFPALLGFRGGKGILCGFAAAIMLDWRVALILIAIFFAVFLLTRYVSLSSVLAAAGFCVAFCLFHLDRPLVAAGGFFLGVLAIVMHRPNIVRLCNGTENKFSIRKKEKNV